MSRLGVTELDDEMIDSQSQRVHPFEDPCVLFLATHSFQASFRSKGLGVKNPDKGTLNRRTCNPA
jgi:hypothetical protein